MTQVLFSYINKKNHWFLIQEKLPAFTEDFKSKILRYRRWEDAQLSLLGRILLEESFKNINVDFCQKKLKYNQYNKPYFEGGDINFNISHSGEIVVCVITKNSEIGIDIEKRRDIDIDSFKSQMTSLEWSRIISSDNVKNTFYDYWTTKEAVAKAHGKGLSIPFQSFEIIDQHTIIDNDHFFTKKIKLDNDYACHVGFKNSIDSISTNEFAFDKQ